MKIETMDQEVQSRPSAMERITAAAETAGRPRSEKVMKLLDRVLGAPEAAGMAVTIAGETANELKDRAENRLVETAMNLAERADNAWARFTNRVTETKDKAIARATELKNKAVKAGIETGFKLEEKVVRVFEAPAVLMEKVSGGFEAKAESDQSKLMSEAVKMVTAEANLTTQQAEIIRMILEAQAAKLEQVSARHELKAAKMQGRIEVARGKASELKAGAFNIRTKVEDRRVFKGLLAKAPA